ncbi:LuxR C-terminal-related transcriptional regulator [Knoellia koreensis]|uniref:Tetratricopeptide repeat protein n=1 Tax=Knoellia koreensis TaxID=2730921 RepID=A0A849HH74_9MICO|nr:tetratricopeptide repeat protein [Knoellia sp. DB2414S]
MLTPCIGRDEVIAQLRNLVDEHRWVTLTGAPGSGKSLVAQHTLGARARVWVRASAGDTRESVVESCLEALEGERIPGDSPTLALKRALDGRDVLLVLDGVDAIDGLGELLTDLLEDAATWRLLCTAQTMARRPHERVLRLAPLKVPEPSEPLDGPALELLLSRIATAGGHLVDLDQHEATLRKLLSASGGLPLLIEQLAAQIALVGVSDVVPVQSMEDAVRASHALLGPDEQQCFRRLAAVGQPMSLDVLAEVCEVSRPQAVQLAGALTRRNLVEVGADGRFGMLAPLREVGRSLAAASGDDVAARAGLVRWADRVLPADFFTGASDQPWLSEVELVAASVADACAHPATRDKGYELANRAFSSLYTAMRPREAVELLEAVLDSGDGPPLVGSQLARRAGICASEVRGTYEGVRLLDRAEEHANALESEADRDLEQARNAAIRAEMHLDAGDLPQARADAERALTLDGSDYVIRQARRTLMDVLVSTGDWDEAEQLAQLIHDSPPEEERWISLSALTLQARIAFEQGRVVEAQSLAQYARDQAVAIHEDRIALLADTLLRHITGEPGEVVDTEHLPWAVRVVVALQEARELLPVDPARAAGRAADVVVLADSSRLGRDAVEARTLVGDALVVLGEPDQAQSSYLSALRRAAEIGMPIQVAHVLDALAALLRAQGKPAHTQLSGAAAALRISRGAVGRSRPGVPYVAGVPGDCPLGWVMQGRLTVAGAAAIPALFRPAFPGPMVATPLDSLTKAERAVAELVAEGLTSRRIAEELFVSPRTVDAHLSHIYRKLDIGSRAKLAALMAEVA